MWPKVWSQRCSQNWTHVVGNFPLSDSRCISMCQGFFDLMNWISHIRGEIFSWMCFFSNQELPTNESPWGSVKITLNLSEKVPGYGPPWRSNQFFTTKFFCVLFLSPGDHSDQLPFFHQVMFFSWKKTLQVFLSNYSDTHRNVFQTSGTFSPWSKCCHFYQKYDGLPIKPAVGT